jgi:DnaJ family protein A protein 2
MSYYEILEIQIDASQEDIRKSFRRLAMIHHPDKGGDQEAFQRINQAYETLNDTNKRQEYDDSMRQPRFRPFNPFGSHHEDNIYNHFFSFMNNANNIHQMFQAMNINVNRPVQRLGNETITLFMTLQEAYDGTVKHLSHKVEKMCDQCMHKCPACKGQGLRIVNLMNGFHQQLATAQCPDCSGSGMLYQAAAACSHHCRQGFYEHVHNLTVNVKSHESTKAHIKFDQLGHQPKSFLELPGDLIVVVKIQPSVDNIKVDESGNITWTPSLSIVDLVCGVPSVRLPQEICFEHDDEHTCCIPPMSLKPAFVIMKEQRGLKQNESGNRGQLIIHPKINYDVNVDDINLEALHVAFHRRVNA